MIPRDVPASLSTPMRTAAALGTAALTVLAGAACASAWAPTAALATATTAAAPDIVVTSAADAGDGTLRAAVEQANATAGPQTIGFAADISAVTIDSPLVSTDALALTGPGVTVAAGRDWNVSVTDPSAPRPADVLLHSQRSSLTVSGVTLDAAQRAESVVFIEAPSARESIVIGDAILRDATGSALVFAGSHAPVSLERSTLIQQDPANRATGIVGEDSSATAVTVTDSTITGFGVTAASFQEWNRVPDTRAEIRFARTTISHNGNIEEPTAPAGAIVLNQSQDVPDVPRLVVTDSVLSGNSGYSAGGIAVSSPGWDAPSSARVVKITGTTFEGNLGYDSDDLSEMAQPSFAAANDGGEADGASEAEPTTEKPVVFDVANSTFVGLEEAPSRVLTLNNPATRSTFDQVTVLHGIVSVAYWVETPVFQMQDTVIESGDWDPINVAQPARSAPAEAAAPAADEPAVPIVATSLRSAYVDAYESGQPRIQSTEDVVVRDPAELRLGTLADNGGQTPTVLPAEDSPLIDAGDTDPEQVPDQRGVPRPQGPRSDIGAVELASSPTTDPSTDPVTDPTTDPSTDPGTEPTTDPSTDPTTDPSTDPAADPATDPGSDPGTDPSTDPSTDPGTDPATEPSTDASTEPGTPSPDARTPDGSALAGTALLLTRARTGTHRT
ncbi:choice-of-anchor Q domain-containing protein [Leucobacter sp. 7(1)]|uniref:choice-of-anchor Q domain-containing protein n=1 Tax=Leucobacter sp. 7(1) TaxID=1255613 RepID=UPI000B361862|nr:choice-of-anchor Q domain-containing protein [Leucobacter sp. 7(1)]